MIKYQVIKNARILFVGINPHHGSFRRGIPFSNNKMFWYLLNRSGMINERQEDLKNDAKLGAIYRNKFSKVYRLSLLNVIRRPSTDTTELKPGEEKRGRTNILNSIEVYKPKVVCFIGKIAFQKFSGIRKVEFGWQPNIFGSKVFVMHFPLRGKAAIRIRELKVISTSS